jgi:hypothetical protein
MESITFTPPLKFPRGGVYKNKKGNREREGEEVYIIGGAWILNFCWGIVFGRIHRRW